MRFLIFGDIIGKPGRRAVRYFLEDHQGDYDVVIANVENSAGGFGMTKKVYEDLKSYGIDVLTSGNHIWDKKEIYNFIDNSEDILRPANYPPSVPGRGWNIYEIEGFSFCVINLMGRIFLEPNLDNPFTTFDRIYEEVEGKVNAVIVDFHAETTSEKWAFGIYADGRASLVYGTHTHVPTADECILKKGTAYTTDVGMTGAWYSVIGMHHREPIERFIYALPRRFKVEEKEDVVLNALIVDIDEKTGRAREIRRIKEMYSS